MEVILQQTDQEKIGLQWQRGQQKQHCATLRKEGADGWFLSQLV
jgi:hypothetical protein